MKHTTTQIRMMKTVFTKLEGTGIRLEMVGFSFAALVVCAQVRLSEGTGEGGCSYPAVPTTQPRRRNIMICEWKHAWRRDYRVGLKDRLRLKKAFYPPDV